MHISQNIFGEMAVGWAWLSFIKTEYTTKVLQVDDFVKNG